VKAAQIAAAEQQEQEQEHPLNSGWSLWCVSSPSRSSDFDMVVVVCSRAAGCGRQV
jgi:hypothetical protein